MWIALGEVSGVGYVTSSIGGAAFWHVHRWGETHQGERNDSTGCAILYCTVQELRRIITATLYTQIRIGSPCFPQRSRV